MYLLNDALFVLGPRCSRAFPFVLCHSSRIRTFCDRLRILQECSLTKKQHPVMQITLKARGRMPPKVARYASKIPDNTILLWLSPKASLRRRDDNTADTESSQLLLSLLFSYHIPEISRSAEVALIRPLDELFLQTCDKVKDKVCKFIAKNLKDVSLGNPESHEMVFSSPSDPNVLLSTNEQVYRDESLTELQINEIIYRIVRRPTRCINLGLKLKSLVGCPLLPRYTFSDDSNMPKRNPEFHWYVAKSDTPVVKPTLRSRVDDQKESTHMIEGWSYRHTGPMYVPEMMDIGSSVCVLLDLGAYNVSHCFSTEGVIENVDEPFIFEQRQRSYCSQRAKEGCVRLMSYNVLADLYLDLKCNQEDLYFPYCPKKFQDYTYRYPVLLKEIPGYQADIIFLQEVDEKLWIRYLPAVMHIFGYESIFKRKGQKVNEGLVICYRKEQFRFIASHDIWLTELLDMDKCPENKDIVLYFDKDNDLKTLFTSRPTVIQITVISSIKQSPSELYILANTHLHFDPRHEIVKVLQTLLCLRWIQRIVADYSKRHSSCRVHAFFAGDFNSTPDAAVCELVKTGNYTAEKHGIISLVQDSAEALHTMKLDSLIENIDFTNYTRHYRYDGTVAGFSGCLDYIWASGEVKVDSVVPFPPKEMIKKYVALPSKICPSDHLPLICDVKLS